jgi:plastocyanin
VARVARLVLCLVCAAAVGAPGYAHADTAALPSTASVNAFDFGFQDPANPSQSTATIATAGTVTFSYPSGASAHNVDFDTAQPTSCSQTAGAVLGAVPPLPTNPQSPGWSGSCQFNTPGTYQFHCDMHPFMTGSVVVGSPTSSPPPPGNPPPPGSSPPPGNQPPAANPLPPSPVARPHPGKLPGVASRLVLTPIQHGAVVHGSINVARGGSRLAVVVLARRSALGSHGSKMVTVGRYVKTVSAGKRSFAVRLSVAVKRALRHKRSLAVTVRVSVKPRTGAASSLSRAATVKR